MDKEKDRLLFSTDFDDIDEIDKSAYLNINDDILMFSITLYEISIIYGCLSYYFD